MMKGEGGRRKEGFGYASDVSWKVSTRKCALDSLPTWQIDGRACLVSTFAYAAQAHFRRRSMCVSVCVCVSGRICWLERPSWAWSAACLSCACKCHGGCRVVVALIKCRRRWRSRRRSSCKRSGTRGRPSETVKESCNGQKRKNGGVFLARQLKGSGSSSKSITPTPPHPFFPPNCLLASSFNARWHVSWWRKHNSCASLCCISARTGKDSARSQSGELKPKQSDVSGLPARLVIKTVNQSVRSAAAAPAAAAINRTHAYISYMYGIYFYDIYAFIATLASAYFQFGVECFIASQFVRDLHLDAML